MKEAVYHRCLVHALQNDGFTVEQKRRVDLEFEGLALHRVLEMDIIVNDTLVLEVKAHDVALDVWDAQVLSYLWHTGLPLGCIVNFRVAHLRKGIRYFINRAPSEEASLESSASSPIRRGAEEAVKGAPPDAKDP